ncbi:MAG TPA: hypothetical protein VJ385_15715 [Fibrobacteria bacterium]|nr:hypothetical protein [Fibrobacteria bacterium]
MPDLKMDQCLNCHTQLLLPGESEKLSSYVLAQESERVGAMPISDFISEIETASLLGESKQGVNKNKKIRNGFIMSTHLSGRRFYLKQSVLLFKKNGDGRFFLGPIYKGEQNVFPSSPFIGAENTSVQSEYLPAESDFKTMHFSEVDGDIANDQ